MRLNKLKPTEGSRKAAQRVGRGASAGKGKTCGRGHKGQNSRSGGGVSAAFEGGQLPLQRRFPTFGFHSRKGAVTGEVRLTDLARVEGDVIDLKSLIEAHVLSHNIRHARIINTGSVEKAFTVKNLGVSKAARAAIEAAGGKIED